MIDWFYVLFVTAYVQVRAARVKQEGRRPIIDPLGSVVWLVTLPRRFLPRWAGGEDRPQSSRSISSRSVGRREPSPFGGHSIDTWGAVTWPAERPAVVSYSNSPLVSRSPAMQTAYHSPDRDSVQGGSGRMFAPPYGSSAYSSGGGGGGSGGGGGGGGGGGAYGGATAKVSPPHSSGGGYKREESTPPEPPKPAPHGGPRPDAVDFSGLGAMSAEHARAFVELLQPGDAPGRITYIDLTGTRMGLAAFSALCEFVRKSDRLSRLSVAGCGLDGLWVAELADAIAACPALRAVDLSRNPLGAQAAVPAVADMLGRSRSLSAVYLQDTGLVSGDVDALAAAASRSPSLTLLHFGDNEYVRELAAEALSERLPRCGQLSALFLGGCSVGGWGATALSESLRGLRNLRLLALPHNAVGDEGARALASLISSGQCCLQVLNLEGNGITAAGCSALANALGPLPEPLPCPPVLSELMLSGNPVGDTGGLAIATALMRAGPGRAHPLAALGLAEVGAGEVAGAALARAAARCPTLCVLSLEGNGAIEHGTLAALESALRGRTFAPSMSPRTPGGSPHRGGPFGSF